MLRFIFRIFDPDWHMLNRLRRERATKSGQFVETYDTYTIIEATGLERVVYEDSRGAVLVKISFPGRRIYRTSIRYWNGWRRVSELDRKTIAARVYYHYDRCYSVHYDITDEG